MKALVRIGGIILVMVLVSGHSPWGQYQVYRQKHLLIMSTISDEPTYSFSRRLVTALNEVLPEANARPARAKHFERLHSLFSTKQMQIMVLSRSNADAAQKGEGPFAEFGPLSFKIIYQLDKVIKIHIQFRTNILSSNSLYTLLDMSTNEKFKI